MAWGVHFFTASGIVCCLLALEATNREDWRTSLFWLAVAVFIDAVDGSLARRAQVKRVLPGFDGALLDNIVDYVSYVVVPALIMHRAGLFPASLSLAVAAAVCVASAWQFCQSDAKTVDHFFKGFPSYWNIVALYLFALELSTTVNFVIIAVLIVLVFVPIKYLYLSRNVPWPAITLPMTLAWTVLASMILWQLPSASPALVWGSMGYPAWYLGLSLHATMQEMRKDPA